MYSPARLLECVLVAGWLLTSSSAATTTPEAAVSQRRELWDFLTFGYLLNFLGPPCTEDPKHWGPKGGPRWVHCEKEYKGSSMYSSYVDTDEDGMSETSDADGEDYSTLSEEVVVEGQDADGGETFENSTGGFELWMVFVGASVVSSVVAVHLGQRKPGVGPDRHEMTGAVMRRAGTVGAFAEGFFPHAAAVEMAPSADYQLEEGQAMI